MQQSGAWWSPASTTPRGSPRVHWLKNAMLSLMRDADSVVKETATIVPRRLGLAINRSWGRRCQGHQTGPTTRPETRRLGRAPPKPGPRPALAQQVP